MLGPREPEQPGPVRRVRERREPARGRQGLVQVPAPGLGLRVSGYSGSPVSDGDGVTVAEAVGVAVVWTAVCPLADAEDASRSA